MPCDTPHAESHKWLNCSSCLWETRSEGGDRHVKNSDAFISSVDEDTGWGVALQDSRCPLGSGQLCSAKYTDLSILLAISTCVSALFCHFRNMKNLRIIKLKQLRVLAWGIEIYNGCVMHTWYNVRDKKQGSFSGTLTSVLGKFS